MAREFSGGAQYLKNDTVVNLGSVNLMTVAALVYADSIASVAKCIASYLDTANSRGWALTVQPDTGILYFSKYEADNGWGTATTAISTGAWYGVAASCFGSGAGNNCTLYRYPFATRALASETVSFYNTQTTAGTYVAGVGMQWVGWGQYPWDGRIARVGLWRNTNLTANELIQWFHGVPVQMASCDLWLELFGVSSPEPDWSRNQNHFVNTDTTRGDHPPMIGFPMMRERKVQYTVAPRFVTVQFRGA